MSELSTKCPEDQCGNYLCPTCKQKTAHSVLTVVNIYDCEIFDGVEVEFYNNYYTTQCMGCKTVCFCHEYRCSEELDFTNDGVPLFNYHRNTYPNIGETEETHFVNIDRIKVISEVKSSSFDTGKLCKMLTELNQCYKNKSFYACIYLIRSIIDHVPPIFGKNNFIEVANNYTASGRSFKDAMLHLQNSSRKIADKHIHSHIKQKEILPTVTQIEFRADFDLLFSEIIEILHK